MSGVKGENSLKLFGDDIEVLAGTAKQIMDVMAAVPGITDLAVFKETGQPNLVISVDRASCGPLWPDGVGHQRSSPGRDRRNSGYANPGRGPPIRFGGAL